MDTAERLLALLGLLQHRWHWSADELAERLEVTTRTVRRDVARLRIYGYPVEAFAGHGGGYQLGRGAALPPLLLDDDETMAVAFGLGVVGVAATSGVAGVDDAAVSALGKIEQLLPLRLRSRLDDLDAATVVPFRDQRALPDRRIVMALAHAVSARRVTTFDYVDGRSATTRREVEPVRMVRLGHAWYLAAFDLGRDDWRTFRVDRIASIDVSDVRSSERSGPDPVELVSRVAPASAFEHRAVVAIAATPDEIRRLVSTAIADLGPGSTTGHGTRATIGTDDLEWLAGYLMGLPWPFEVLEPDALRRRIADRAGALAARHAPPV
ncbi:MAG: WYL domain-containing protein [Actinobacteria bacterium]|nr:WYL domain-containing protein [Actinomycetota bacterium]